MKICNAILNIVVLLSGYSCSQQETPKCDVNLDTVRYTIELKNLKDSTDIRYSELFSKVRYIALESHPSSAIIGSVSRMEITNNGDIVVFDKTNSRIARFDSCGHFLNLIGERGHGPNEFLQPKSICYDKYRDQILVLDSWTGKLLLYTLDGKMVNSKETPYPDEIRVTDSDHRILFYNYFPECSDCNYLICTNEGKECTKFEPVLDSFVKKSHPATNYVFAYMEDNALLCKSGYSSILYKVQGNNVEPYVELISEEKSWSMGRPEQLMTAYENRFKAEVNKFQMVNKKLVLEGYNSVEEYSFEYWTDFHCFSRAGNKMINDIDGLVAKVGCYINCRGKDIYKSCNSDEFKKILDCWEKRKDISHQDKEFVSIMAKHINPIFQVCTVKDSATQ